MTSTNDTTAELSALLDAGRARRNLAFGLVVGAVVAAGSYYTQVIAPAETTADPLFYIVLAAVLGLSIAMLLAAVLTTVTLYKRGRSATGH